METTTPKNYLRIRESGSHCPWWARNPVAANRTAPGGPAAVVVGPVYTGIHARPGPGRHHGRFRVSRCNLPYCTRRRRRSQSHPVSVLLSSLPAIQLCGCRPATSGMTLPEPSTLWALASHRGCLCDCRYVPHAHVSETEQCGRSAMTSSLNRRHPGYRFVPWSPFLENLTFPTYT